MNKKIIVRHIFVWLIFIGYEIGSIKFIVGLRGDLIEFLLYYVLYIGLFYTNAHIVLDFAFFKNTRPYLASFLLITAEVLVFMYLKLELDHFLSHEVSFHYHVFFTTPYILSNFFRVIFFVGFSIAYWSMLSFIRYKEKNHRAETAQLKTLSAKLELENKFMAVENAYLHNQISPHLLFNSLNIIYQSVKTNSPEAGESVARLAELMRYSLVSSDDVRMVFLRDEVKQIENLVELCRMRFGKEFFFRFTRKGRLQDVEIIPLILITLVENMMKHGDLGERKFPGRVKLEHHANLLSFEAFNKKRDVDLYPKGGLGLKNMERRLKNHYQQRYTLITQDKDDFFTVNLTIAL